MSVFIMIAVPMLFVALLMFYLARKKQEKNFLIPGFVMLAASFINAVIGFTTG